MPFLQHHTRQRGVADVTVPERSTTGIVGLDDFLHGGPIPFRPDLVEGKPGSGIGPRGRGKPTIAPPHAKAAAPRGDDAATPRRSSRSTGHARRCRATQPASGCRSPPRPSCPNGRGVAIVLVVAPSARVEPSRVSTIDAIPLADSVVPFRNDAQRR